MLFQRRLLLFWLPFSCLAAPPLSVTALTLHQYEGGPPLGPAFRFGRGESVFVRYRVVGFARSKDQRVHLECMLEALDERGLRLVPAQRQTVETELAPQDKDWAPVVRHEFVIPPLLDPGTYRIVVAVEDKLSGAKARAETSFLVRGPTVEPSPVLVARNFRFLKGEEGPAVEGAPVFLRGETLWARFEITGYRIGEDNRIEVEYGLSVLGATGKEIYSEPVAAAERSNPFYPHRYLPGILSLDLKKAEPGDYTLVLRIRDLVGNQQYEERYPFQVR
ncbi:MAG: hypothetical protein RMI94_09495 [Bryobacterales bacterium]|nr:hypothetical protein [Bryobacteraceae bacterium]MDW8130768.1 hypothetical protein [Bryobacterales bacterium]